MPETPTATLEPGTVVQSQKAPAAKQTAKVVVLRAMTVTATPQAPLVKRTSVVVATALHLPRTDHRPTPRAGVGDSNNAPQQLQQQ